MSPIPEATLDHERTLAASGLDLLIGVDEVGRGAAAGPVCVGAVAIRLGDVEDITGLRDSKLLSAKARDAAVPRIHAWALAGAVGEAGPEEVDTHGIIAALRLAGQRALAQLGDLGPGSGAIVLDGSHDWLTPPPPDLLSTLEWDEPPYAVRTMVKADLQMATVAAASVLAKVHRDAIMERLDAAHPGYGWAGNKGYLAAGHRAGIAELGLSPQHRSSWKIEGGTA